MKPCRLGTLLRRLDEQLPAERVLNVPLEWMQEEPAREYRRVVAHLGVDDDEREDFPPANEARGHRSGLLQKALRLGARLRVALRINKGFGLGRLNEQPQAKAALSPEFQAELETAFADERALRDEFVATEAGRHAGRECAVSGHRGAPADEKVHP